MGEITEMLSMFFYIHITYHFRSSAIGFKACHFRSARVPQAVLTTFYGENTVQKQIFTEEPCDFHVFLLYLCFLFRIEVLPYRL